MNWYKISQCLSIEKKFPLVILYHGSFANNLKNILSNGIIPIRINSTDIIQGAISEIARYLGLNNEQYKEWEGTGVFRYAKERLDQSGFDKVYLSGDPSYAISNAGASGEYYENLLLPAIRIKYEEHFTKQHSYWEQEQKIIDLIKAKEEGLRGNIAPEERVSIYDEMHKLNLELRKIEKSSSEDMEIKTQNQNIEKLKNEMLSKRFGDKTILFTIILPYRVFKEKLASSHSRDRVKQFEEEYQKHCRGEENWFNRVESPNENIWQFLQEIHLTSVESEYIYDYEEIEL
jgi:hypothetical protein